MKDSIVPSIKEKIMEYKVPPFDERVFLLTLLWDYQFRKGNEIQHIGTHTFETGPDGRLAQWVPELVENKKEQIREPEWSKFAGSVIIKPHAKRWFEEGCALGYVEKTDKFTNKGYKKALEYQKPIKSFWERHWKWIIPTIAAVFGAIGGVVASIVMVLQFFKE